MGRISTAFWDKWWFVKMRLNGWFSMPRNSDYFAAPWRWQLALHWRLPALLAVGYGLRCNYICYQYKKAPNGHNDSDIPTAITYDARLLDIGRVKNLRLGLPRYWVRYEYWVDGVRYESKRATTGSPYRDWMGDWYMDTMTEAEYLQAMPVLRVGEKCAVWYNKSNPGSYPALAFDGNSFETGVLVILGGFPLAAGSLLRSQLMLWRMKWFPRPMKVKMPKWAADHERAAQQGGAPTSNKGPGGTFGGGDWGKI